MIAARLRPTLEAVHVPAIPLARGDSKTIGRSAHANFDGIRAQSGKARG